MRSVQTYDRFPLSSVKPLDTLQGYRQECLALTREVLAKGSSPRDFSPITGARLVAVGGVEGIPYARCPQTGSLFLARMPSSSEWARLLSKVTQHRVSSSGFHSTLAQSRTDNVYSPKLDWIEETLRLQEVVNPRLLQAGTFPSEFTRLLRDSGLFSEVLTCDEMSWSLGSNPLPKEGDVQAAVLLESLDRVSDPGALLKGVAALLAGEGLLFVTALVSSGFDMAVLGLKNQYLYPPDRANCFSLEGLTTFLSKAGFSLIEVSTPGVLDIEIVLAHLKEDPSLTLSTFERQIIRSDSQVKESFQTFLQQQAWSSYARIVARKTGNVKK